MGEITEEFVDEEDNTPTADEPMSKDNIGWVIIVVLIVLVLLYVIFGRGG